jgi:hypothetical protein
MLRRRSSLSAGGRTMTDRGFSLRVKQRCTAIGQQEATHMLSEKFVLVLEALLKSNDRVYPDGVPKIVSKSPHVPVRLPAGK